MVDTTKVVKRRHGTADRLLLDVPCSGLGVLRRNPETRWRLAPESLDRLRATQREILARIDSGAIEPRGDVTAFAGDEAVFTDGSRAAFDVVICATGYETTLPFLDARLLGAATPAATPRLFLNLLHPTRDDVAVVGLIQPDSGQWGLTDLQSRLVARMAAAARRAPRASGWLYAERQRPPRTGAIRYVDSPRHALEVEHFSYRRELERLVAGMDRRLRRDPIVA